MSWTEMCSQVFHEQFLCMNPARQQKQGSQLTSNEQKRRSIAKAEHQKLMHKYKALQNDISAVVSLEICGQKGTKTTDKLNVSNFSCGLIQCWFAKMPNFTKDDILHTMKILYYGNNSTFFTICLFLDWHVCRLLQNMRHWDGTWEQTLPSNSGICPMKRKHPHWYNNIGLCLSIWWMRKTEQPLGKVPLGTLAGYLSDVFHILANVLILLWHID